MSWGAPPPGHNPYYAQQQQQPVAGYAPQQPVFQSAGQPGYAGGPPTGYAGGPPPQRPPAGNVAPAPQGGMFGQAPAGFGQQQPFGGHNPAYGGQPPGGYGGAPPGAPPPASGYGVPPGGYGQPPSGPPPGISPDIWQWFQAVDQDRSGKITSNELQRALMNGNWTPFNPETCRLMIGMFDRDRNGTIGINEFGALWKYVQDWKNCFDRFDTDRSGTINAGELLQALKTFGYNLSINFCQVCVRVFDKQNVNTMNFDDFIQCCVLLKSLTDKFSEKDTQQQGVISIQYEEFLRMVLDNTIIK